MTTTEPICTTSQVIASVATTAALSAVTLVAARAIEKQARWFVVGGALLSATGGILVWKWMAPESVEVKLDSGDPQEPETLAQWLRNREPTLVELTAERERLSADPEVREALGQRLDQLAADHPLLAAQWDKTKWFLEEGWEWEEKYKENPATADAMMVINNGDHGADTTARLWGTYHGYDGKFTMARGQVMTGWSSEQSASILRLLLAEPSQNMYTAKMTAAMIMNTVDTGVLPDLVAEFASDETLEFWEFCLRRREGEGKCYKKLFEICDQPQHVARLLGVAMPDWVILRQAHQFSADQLVAAVRDAKLGEKLPEWQRKVLAYRLSPNLMEEEIHRFGEVLDVKVLEPFDWKAALASGGTLPLSEALVVQVRGKPIDPDLFTALLEARGDRGDLKLKSRALGRAWSGQNLAAHQQLMAAVGEPGKVVDKVVAFIMKLNEGEGRNAWLTWILGLDHRVKMAYRKEFEGCSVSAEWIVDPLKGKEPTAIVGEFVEGKIDFDAMDCWLIDGGQDLAAIAGMTTEVPKLLERLLQCPEFAKTKISLPALHEQMENLPPAGKRLKQRITAHLASIAGEYKCSIGDANWLAEVHTDWQQFYKGDPGSIDFLVREGGNYRVAVAVWASYHGVRGPGLPQRFSPKDAQYILPRLLEKKPLHEGDQTELLKQLLEAVPESDRADVVEGAFHADTFLRLAAAIDPSGGKQWRYFGWQRKDEQYVALFREGFRHPALVTHAREQDLPKLCAALKAQADNIQDGTRLAFQIAGEKIERVAPLCEALGVNTARLQACLAGSYEWDEAPVLPPEALYLQMVKKGMRGEVFATLFERGYSVEHFAQFGRAWMEVHSNITMRYDQTALFEAVKGREDAHMKEIAAFVESLQYWDYCHDDLWKRWVLALPGDLPNKYTNEIKRLGWKDFG